jgi:hypothetical protein
MYLLGVGAHSHFLLLNRTQFYVLSVLSVVLFLNKINIQIDNIESTFCGKMSLIFFNA